MRMNQTWNTMQVEPSDLIADEQQLMAESYNFSALRQAKEILFDLWTQGRIDLSVRALGEGALSAALHALEEPGVRDLSMRDGLRAAAAQHARKGENDGRPF